MRSTTHNLDLMYGAVRFGFAHLVTWKLWLCPALSDAVDDMIARKEAPLQFAEVLDDIGHFCQRLAGDIMDARQSLGLPVTHEPKAKTARPVPGPPKPKTSRRRRDERVQSDTHLTR